MEYVNNLLSKEQEKELLSSLAITEIEQNQINKDNSFYDNKFSIRKLDPKISTTVTLYLSSIFRNKVFFYFVIWFTIGACNNHMISLLKRYKMY